MKPCQLCIELSPWCVSLFWVPYCFTDKWQHFRKKGLEVEKWIYIPPPVPFPPCPPKMFTFVIFFRSLIGSPSASVSQHIHNPTSPENPLKITQPHQLAAGRSKGWSGAVNMSSVWQIHTPTCTHGHTHTHRCDHKSPSEIGVFYLVEYLTGNAHANTHSSAGLGD